MLTIFDLIFNKKYFVRVPNFVSQTLKNNTKPRVSSGDPKVDMAVATSLTTAAYTVDQMIEAHAFGYPIRLASKEDAREVYHSIEQHLFNIRQNALDKKGSLNVKAIDVEDVAKMDNFSRELTTQYPGIIEVDDNDVTPVVNGTEDLLDLVRRTLTRNVEESEIKVDMSQVLGASK